MRRPQLSFKRSDALAIPKDEVGGVAEELELWTEGDDGQSGVIAIVVGESTTHRTVRISMRDDAQIYLSGWIEEEE